MGSVIGDGRGRALIRPVVVVRWQVEDVNESLEKERGLVCGGSGVQTKLQFQNCGCVWSIYVSVIGST